MKSRALFVFACILGIMALLIVGCKKSTEPEGIFTDEDKAEIQSSIESDPLFSGDDNSLTMTAQG